MTVKALEDKGYEVVKFHIGADKFAFAKKFFYGVACTEMAPGMSRAIRKHGENVPANLNVYLFLLIHRGPLFRKFVASLLRAFGMGRLAEMVGCIVKMKPCKYENLIKERYEFCYQFSETW